MYFCTTSTDSPSTCTVPIYPRGVDVNTHATSKPPVPEWYAGQPPHCSPENHSGAGLLPSTDYDGVLYSDFLQYLRFCHLQSPCHAVTDQIWMQFQQQINLYFHSHHAPHSALRAACRVEHHDCGCADVCPFSPFPPSPVDPSSSSSSVPLCHPSHSSPAECTMTYSDSLSVALLPRMELELTLELTQILQQTPRLGVGLFLTTLEPYDSRETDLNKEEGEVHPPSSGMAHKPGTGRSCRCGAAHRQRGMAEVVCAAAVTQWLAERVSETLYTASDTRTGAEDIPPAALIALRQWVNQRLLSPDQPFSFTWRGQPARCDAGRHGDQKDFEPSIFPFPVCRCHLRLLHLPTLWQAKRFLLDFSCGGEGHNHETPANLAASMRLGSPPIPISSRLLPYGGDAVAVGAGSGYGNRARPSRWRSSRRCIGVVTSVCFQSRQQEVPNEWATLQLIQDVSIDPKGRTGVGRDLEGWKWTDVWHRCASRAYACKGGAKSCMTVMKNGREVGGGGSEACLAGDPSFPPLLFAVLPEIRIRIPTTTTPAALPISEQKRFTRVLPAGTNDNAGHAGGACPPPALYDILQVGQLLDIEGEIELFSGGGSTSGAGCRERGVGAVARLRTRGTLPAAEMADPTNNTTNNSDTEPAFRASRVGGFRAGVTLSPVAFEPMRASAGAEEAAARFAVRCWTGFRCAAGPRSTWLHFLSVDAVVALFLSTLRSQYWSCASGSSATVAGELEVGYSHKDEAGGGGEIHSWAAAPLSVLLADEGPPQKSWLEETLAALSDGLDPLLFHVLTPSAQRRCQAKDYLPLYEVRNKLTKASSTGSRGPPSAGTQSSYHPNGTESFAAVPALNGRQYIEQIRAGVLSAASPHTLVLSQISLLPAGVLRLLQSICLHASDLGELNRVEDDIPFNLAPGSEHRQSATTRSTTLTPQLAVKRDGGHSSPYQIPTSILFGLRDSEGGGVALQLARQPLLFSLAERVDVALRPTLDPHRHRLWEAALSGGLEAESAGSRSPWCGAPLDSTASAHMSSNPSSSTSLRATMRKRASQWQSVFRLAIRQLRGLLPLDRTSPSAGDDARDCSSFPVPPPSDSSLLVPCVTESCSTLLQMYFLAAKAVFRDAVEAPTMLKLVKLTQIHALIRHALALQTEPAPTVPAHTPADNHHQTITPSPLAKSCELASGDDEAAPTTMLVDALVGIGLCDSTQYFLTGKTVLGTCVLRLLEAHYNPVDKTIDDGAASSPSEWATLMAEELEKRSRWVPPQDPRHCRCTPLHREGVTPTHSTNGYLGEEEEEEGMQQHDSREEGNKNQSAYVERLVQELLDHFRTLICSR